ncbi:hypothetical protein [Stieleria varia]|uniref:Uncharacterized protein n=1 Tax=Stieleria varia TaxID=2528005 RepID=A0A5C5ZYU5_9BACT|nr:hypothetical protein [Stieleria varia]TWT92782.1 hypothetical protein Pla52n_61470 [Stieleria varia]
MHSPALLLLRYALPLVIATLSVQHTSLSWQGKRVRLAVQIKTLNAIAEPLRESWPRQDGEVAPIGPFMAYPFGHPRTLLLLQPPQVATGGISVTEIQRDPNGAIKLKLNGVEHDDWVEWHPQNSRPHSFVGGLGDRHRLLMSAEIGSGWHLVRYDFHVASSIP